MRGAIAVLLLSACGRVGFDGSGTALEATITPAARVTFTDLDVRITFATMDPDALVALAVPPLVHEFVLPDASGPLSATFTGHDTRGRVHTVNGTVEVAAGTTATLHLAIGAGLLETCTDGVIDAGESDVDCGGGCPACAVGSACTADSACETGSCPAGTCEPASVGWLDAAPMPTERFAAAGALGGDGRFYIFGGDTAVDMTPLVYGYDGTLDTWAPADQLPTQRSRLAGASDGTGAMYAIGGDVAGTPQSTVETLTPGGTWTAAPSLPTPTSFTAAGSTGGTVYLIGGDDGTMASGSVLALENGVWVAHTKLPAPRSNLAVTRDASGRLIAIGGHDHTTVTFYEDADAYDRAADAWTALASLPTGRSDLCAATGADGRIYALGGYDGVVAYPIAQALRPGATHWVDVPSMAVERDACTAGTLPDGRVIVAGGRMTDTTPVASAQLYGPYVTLTPAGERIAVTGANFAANAQVRVYVDGVVVELGATDAAGTLLPLSFIAPAGTHTVTIVDDRSLYPIARPL